MSRRHQRWWNYFVTDMEAAFWIWSVWPGWNSPPLWWDGGGLALDVTLWHSEFQQFWVGLSNMKIIIPELFECIAPSCDLGRVFFLFPFEAGFPAASQEFDNFLTKKHHHNAWCIVKTIAILFISASPWLPRSANFASRYPDFLILTGRRLCSCFEVQVLISSSRHPPSFLPSFLRIYLFKEFMICGFSWLFPCNNGVFISFLAVWQARTRRAPVLGWHDEVIWLLFLSSHLLQWCCLIGTHATFFTLYPIFPAASDSQRC